MGRLPMLRGMDTTPPEMDTADGENDTISRKTAVSNPAGRVPAWKKGTASTSVSCDRADDAGAPMRFPPSMTYREFHLGTHDYEQAIQLREAVLRIPLGLTLTEAELADEPNCRHLGGFDGERLVAVLLLRPLDEETVKMRQVAVHPEFQNAGMGSKLVAFAERFAKERGFTKMVAHARGTAVDFYQKAGYATVGDDFLEQTIPHRLVTKEL